MLVAVYGRLKYGRSNSYLMRGLEAINKQWIEGFVMYSAGGFPVIFESESSSKVWVEVYDVPQSLLEGDLDRLEGHPNWYRRQLVDTEVGKAWIYVMQDDRYKKDERLIESGEF